MTVFYDHLLELDDLRSEIDSVAESQEEREELWQLVDEIIHHRILHVLLDNLDHEHHPDFIELYHKCPHDEVVLVFIKDKLGEGYEEIVKSEARKIASEVLEELHA
jgi:hypothetical protein